MGSSGKENSLNGWRKPYNITAIFNAWGLASELK